jgi:dihydrolipoamide dehydrogenase
LSLNAIEGFVKLVVDKESGLILGGQIVGPGAPDLIAEIGLAIEMGSTLEDIALTIHTHPTLNETVAETAENALGQGVHNGNTEPATREGLTGHSSPLLLVQLA